MKHAALALVATLTLSGGAHAQVWPNATPSPYGPATASGPSATPAPAMTTMPAPAAASGNELGAPPHALGTAAPNLGMSSSAATSGSGAPVIADVDNPQSSRATAALNVLEAQGYAGFSDFRPNGSMFTALVNDDGQQFPVVINPDTGQISRQ
ncbi:MAG: hypothetical protein ACREEL_07030 [Stellaceae bacterium]